MPSQETKWYKDARLVQALDEIRQKNLAFMSYCYYCDAKSVGIKAVKEKLYPVCEKHEKDSQSKDSQSINDLLKEQTWFEE